MRNSPLRPNMTMVIVAFGLLFGSMLSCARAIQSSGTGFWSVSGSGLDSALSSHTPSSQESALQATLTGPIQTPTPDDPHPLPPLRSQEETYTVQAGDSLGQIAGRYSVSLKQLIDANDLGNPDLLYVGQVLQIPVPTLEGNAPSLKIIPDSELVYGPASVGFDIANFIKGRAGYLARYTEELDGHSYTGAQIVQFVAQDYSVNPRLLLAVLEYQSGWVTRPDPDPSTQEFPIGIQDPQRKGLYLQLTWAANNLNRGFYLWRVNGAPAWGLADGTIVPASPTINAGTAGVQQFFALLFEQQGWLEAIGENGLLATYTRLFGYPFTRSVEPLIPPDLKQPAMQLPFENGAVWSYTGGPHPGWADGSAWAALDFAPPSEALGCVQNDAWAVAVADGVITRAGSGAVIQDLDDDGYEQTGWVVLYMHIETRDRVQPGAHLKAGDHIGHPSCEGGVSTGTHIHLARRYNGEWIPADQDIPFVLDGWRSSGGGAQYDGVIQRDGKSIEAYAGRSPTNSIQR